MTSTEEWKARGATASLLGYDIFYRDEDAREECRGTIFLIHGFPTASWDWDKVWPELNRHYRLVAPDMLGFGFSDKPSPHDYRIMEQADICEALVRYLDLQEFHVLAHDYGDTVAQEMLAREFPHQSVLKIGLRMEDGTAHRKRRHRAVPSSACFSFSA